MQIIFWIAKRRLNFQVAFFVEAVLFIFKKEENKIPAIQQMVWAKSDSEVLSGSSTKHCYWSLLVIASDV